MTWCAVEIQSCYRKTCTSRSLISIRKLTGFVTSTFGKDMHQYAAIVAARDVLEVGDVFDGGLEAVLFPFGASEDKICRGCGDDHYV